MAELFRTIIIPAQHITLARTIAASFGPGGVGMFTTPLAPPDATTPTHFISSGYIPEQFVAMIPPMQTNPNLIYSFIQQNGIDCTLQDIQGLFTTSDVSADEPFAAMARLGLNIVDYIEPYTPTPEPEGTNEMATIFFGIHDNNWVIRQEFNLNDENTERVLNYLKTTPYGHITETQTLQIPDPNWTPGEDQSEDDRPTISVEHSTTRPATQEELVEGYTKDVINTLVQQTVDWEKQQAIANAIAQIIPIPTMP